MTLYDEDGQKISWPRDLPWSHSALGKFEDCPLLYGETTFNKTKYPFVENEAAKTGKEIHKKFEDYITVGTELPNMLQPYGRLIDVICKDAKEVLPERDVNLTWELEPCSVFHYAVSYRGRIDLTVVRPDNDAIIFDFKTGRYPDDPDDQLEYQSVALLLEKPHVLRVHPYYIYTKHPKRRVSTVERDHLPFLAKKIIPRLMRMKEARDKKNFPPKPGVQCKWCPVASCKYNENRKLVG